MASPQIFEDLSSGFSILLQKKSEHTFLCYPLFQDYLNLLTLISRQPLSANKRRTHVSQSKPLHFRLCLASPGGFGPLTPRLGERIGSVNSEQELSL